MSIFSKLIPRTLMVSALLLVAPSAFAGPAEEDFVREQAGAGLDILSNTGLSETQRSEQFGQFIDQIVDIRKVSRFSLGKYARNLDAAVYADFQSAFTDYAKGIYQDSLTRYGGETFLVTGSVDRKPGDAVVSTTISGGALDKPLKVRWRVRTKDGVSKVIDLEAFGIWLAVQQRSEITAYIANHGGKVASAADMLRAKTAKP
ncbi:MAG: toluene tolerance protein [Robiginitomaculum sp.]|nr:MAG: toluene tolerance protein [Robiginitomaculum sp.]